MSPEATQPWPALITGLRRQHESPHSPQDPLQVMASPSPAAYLLMKHFVRPSGFLSSTWNSSFIQKKAISSLSKLPISFHCCFLELGPWRQHLQCGLFQRPPPSTHTSLPEASCFIFRYRVLGVSKLAGLLSSKTEKFLGFDQIWESPFQIWAEGPRSLISLKAAMVSGSFQS